MPPDSAHLGCHDLDPAACRLDSRCLYSECYGCDCAPAFATCLEQGEAPPFCPPPNCPSPPMCCRQASDCTLPGSYCALEAPTLCGTCLNGGDSSCSSDGDCSSGQICEPVPCTCNLTVMACRQGCTSDADCAELARCGSDHRCHARPCDATCSGNLTCNGSTCVRRACNGDGDCGSGGFCVDHLCSRSLGQCVLLLP